MKKRCFNNYLLGLLAIIGVSLPSGALAESVTVTLHPNECSSSNNATSTENACNSTENSTFATLSISTWGGAAYAYYTFDFSEIPTNINITSVSCKVKAKISNKNSLTSTAQLYNNTTAKGSAITIDSTSDETYTLTAGTWTRTELNNLVLRFDASTTTWNSTRTMQIYGADLTITYEVADPKAITVNYSKIYIKKGQTLTPSIVMGEGYTGTVLYTSSKPEVATIDENGVITGVAQGATTITITPEAVDGYDCTPISFSFNVTTGTSSIPKYFTETITSANLATSTPGNSQTIYLYNKATGLYLNTGGHWGTEGMLKETGLPVYIDGTISGENVTGVTMYSQYNTKKWGYVNTKHTEATTALGLYVDASDNFDNLTFNFIKNSDDSYSITPVHCADNYYLTQNADGSVRNNIVTAKEYTDERPDEARWFIVTRADIEKAFDEANATEAVPVPATFMIDNPDFARQVAQGWEFDPASSTSWTNYVRIGNSLFNKTNPTGDLSSPTVESLPTNEDNAVMVPGKIHNGSGTYNLSGEAGNNYVIHSEDRSYIGEIETTRTTIWYNYIYGGYYNARIVGTSGTISQTKPVVRTGWYRVIIDGYIYNPEGANGVATLFFGQTGMTDKNTKYYDEDILKTNNTFEDGTQAGITLSEGNYRSSAYVYLTAGQQFTVGVKLENGTSGTAGENATSTNVYIDNVQFEYCGNAETQIILNEEEGSTDYLTEQIEANEARTMLLKRKMTLGKWNSLVLPVRLSAASLKTAFGDDVKLCEFSRAEGSTIYFENVDLSNAENVAVTPGKCYIIKTTKAPAYTSGTHYVEEGNSSKYNVEASAESPIYTFSQVTLASVPEVAVSEEFSTAGTDDINPMIFKGTYTKVATDQNEGNANGIHYGSYVISANDGLWYHWKGVTNATPTGNENGNYVEYTASTAGTLGTKGFRCWIAPLNPKTEITYWKNTESGEIIEESENPTPSKLRIVINGEGVEATSIGDIQFSVAKPAISNVYSVSGQMVGNNANLNALPKGVYIINGKKYVVK